MMKDEKNEEREEGKDRRRKVEGNEGKVI